jgi:hypothetical protein
VTWLTFTGPTHLLQQNLRIKNIMIRPNTIPPKTAKIIEIFPTADIYSFFSGSKLLGRKSSEEVKDFFNSNIDSYFCLSSTDTEDFHFFDDSGSATLYVPWEPVEFVFVSSKYLLTEPAILCV